MLPLARVLIIIIKAAFSIQLSSYGNKILEEVVMKEYRERNCISNSQNVPATKIGSKL